MAILLTEAAKPSSDVPRNPPPTRPSRQRPAATTIKAPTHTEATARLPKASNQPFLHPSASIAAKKSLDYHTGANIQTRSAAHLFRVLLDQGDDEVRHLSGATRLVGGALLYNRHSRAGGNPCREGRGGRQFVSLATRECYHERPGWAAEAIHETI